MNPLTEASQTVRLPVRPLAKAAPLKVLHLSFSDYGAGAGTSVALHRLHEGLKRQGIGSSVLCRIKTVDSADSIKIPRSRIMERTVREVTSRVGLNDLHAISSFAIQRHPAYLDCDVLHIHSLHSGYFNYLALPSITRRKPVIWTIHDLWAITGHCSFPFDCTRWKTGCGKCPYPETYPPIRRDATAWEWKLKKRIYRHSKLAVAVTSEWEAGVIGQSLLNRFPLKVIPYGVDTQFYKPLDKDVCRRQLGLPSERKVILFSAAKLSNPRKGGDLLRDAIGKLPRELKRDLFLLTTGKLDGVSGDWFGIEAKHMGLIDEGMLPRVYSAADVFAFPTRSDTFGLVSIESMACGLPVIAFRVGGIPAQVRDGSTGYTVQPENSSEFAERITQLLMDDQLRDVIAKECRKVAVEEYSTDLEVKRYIDLYRLLTAVPQ